MRLYQNIFLHYFRNILNNTSRLNKARMWSRMENFSNLIRCFWILKVQKFSFIPKFKYPFHHIRCGWNICARGYNKIWMPLNFNAHCQKTIWHFRGCLIYWLRALWLLQLWKMFQIITYGYFNDRKLDTNFSFISHSKI